MCFSAGASFGAAAVIGTAGVVTLNKVTRPSQLMFASMPLLFALQQVAEGFVWLSFNYPSLAAYRPAMVYAFLIFAQILWPAFVPIAVWSMEPDQRRKRFLLFISLLGLIASALLAYRLIVFPVEAGIAGRHIRYDIGSPQWMISVTSVLYVITTVIAPLSSTLRYMKFIALLLLTSLIVTEIFFHYYLISVWCFFSALLSVVIYFALHREFDRSHIQSILGNYINPEKAEW